MPTAAAPAASHVGDLDDGCRLGVHRQMPRLAAASVQRGSWGSKDRWKDDERSHGGGSGAGGAASACHWKEHAQGCGSDAVSGKLTYKTNIYPGGNEDVPNPYTNTGSVAGAVFSDLTLLGGIASTSPNIISVTSGPTI